MNHARIAQLCWPLGIVPYVVSICWVYILWLASIGSFYMPMCESCWVCILWLASIWYFHTNVWILLVVYLMACINWMLLYTYIWILFESCWVCILCVASIGCFYAPMCQSCVNLVSILLGVHILACINWMLLYTYVWTFWFCGRKMG